MFRYALCRFLLSVQIVCFGLFASGDVPSRLVSIDVQTKHNDDIALVQAAAGLIVGEPLVESDFQTALSAVRLTDRFRKVEGQLVSGPNGVIARVSLDSWPIVSRIVWLGDVHNPNVKKYIRGLRAGMCPGNLKLATWSRELQEKLIEVGYPEGKVYYSRSQDDKRLIITVKAGEGVLLRKVDIVGDFAPYTADEIRRFTNLVPGRTLWTANTQREVLRNIYRIMRSHKRYEAEIDLKWDGSGTLVVNINPGPRVLLVVNGVGIDWFGKIKKLIPLVSVDSYSPGLLYEGDRRIVHYLQSEGYLDAQVWHRRVEFKRKNPSDATVTYIYTISFGKRYYLNEIRFTGNIIFKETELKRITRTSRNFFALKGQLISPDFLDELEHRVKTFYLSRGYVDVSLRRQLEYNNGKHNITLKIREGSQHLIKWLRLELPQREFSNPWVFGRCLALVILEKQKPTVPVLGTADKIYKSDRRHLSGTYGSLNIDNKTNNIALTFTLNRSIPLVKSDLARVVAAVRQQCLPAVDTTYPLVNLRLESVDGAVGACVKVQDQYIDRPRRLVVTGLDRTKAKAIFRKTKLPSSFTLDRHWLNDMQYRLSSSSAFQRVELRSLLDQEHATVTYAGSPLANWGTGDLQLSLEEGKPYVITSSFGYDKSQGYRIGLGLTQLNVGGMGRTIDYEVRIGSGFIKNPKLAKIFPTGTSNRSIDSLTVSYTDPWFATELLKKLPADRTNYCIEVACIREQAGDLLYRRRILNTLQWTIDQESILKLGHRWEHTDDIPDCSQCGKSKFVLSAPFIQIDRDTRDNPFDPTHGTHSMARMELTNQSIFSPKKAGFIKLDLKYQKVWSIGSNFSKSGVISLGLRLGAIKPTNGQNEVPYAERFFAGGPSSFRGVGLDELASKRVGISNNGNKIGINDAEDKYGVPNGGRGLILINAEYQFPLFGQSFCGEIFVDSGQIYKRLSHHLNMPRPSFRTALGFGLIFKFGIPIRVEYATDMNHILGRYDSKGDKGQLLISAGSQF